MKNTCANFQGLSLKNGVDIWTFVRKNEFVALFLSKDLVVVQDPIFFLSSA